MSFIPPQLRLNEDRRADFMHVFDEPTRRSLLADDAFAWKVVCSLLIAIVSLGLLIGIVAVAFAW